MPYIPKDRKDILLPCLPECGKTPGELNFILTETILHYIFLNKLSYQTINDVIGALEGAKLEFYARVVRPYEDQKIKENGDVY